MMGSLNDGCDQSEAINGRGNESNSYEVAKLTGGSTKVDTAETLREQTLHPVAASDLGLNALLNSSAAELQKDDELTEVREIERVARSYQE